MLLDPLQEMSAGLLALDDREMLVVNACLQSFMALMLSSWIPQETLL
jgi:hypothetical protein